MADAAQHGHGAAHGGHDAHGAHLPNLQHHFETPAQQFDASKLGMWLFLATEVLFFAGLFCFYAIVRLNHPEVFAVGHLALDTFWGAVNTIVLIASSFTMALGVYCAQTSNRSGLVICLVLTLLGAAGFMGIKAVEYNAKIQHGTVWGKYYSAHKHGHHGDAHGDAHAPAAGHETTHAAESGSAESPVESAPVDASAAAAATPIPEVSQIKLAPAGPAGLRAATADEHPEFVDDGTVKNLHLFFSVYFCLTGLHGIHVLAGMVVLTWLLIGAIKGRYDGSYYTPVDLVGLYWHLVDLVWIFLFPLLYLI